MTAPAHSHPLAGMHPGTAHVLRCPTCEVTWRGTADVTCWCCGASGTPRGEVRLVSDEDD